MSTDGQAAHASQLAHELRSRIREECRDPVAALAVVELVAVGILAAARQEGDELRDVERLAAGIYRRLLKVRAALATPRKPH